MHAANNLNEMKQMRDKEMMKGVKYSMRFFMRIITSYGLIKPA